jgi:hypothetical protein
MSAASASKSVAHKRASEQNLSDTFITISAEVRNEKTTYYRIIRRSIHYRFVRIRADRGQHSSHRHSTEGSTVDAIAKESRKAAAAERTMAERTVAERTTPAESTA